MASAENRSSVAAVSPAPSEPAPLAPAEAKPDPELDGESDGQDVPYLTRLGEVFRAFFPLGFLAFGGPQAHIGMFLKTFVEDKKWLDKDRFMELMSLGQAMPGPTSTQMATALGITRAGWLGGLVSFVLFDWVGFVVCIAVGSLLNALVEGESADRGTVDLYREVVVGMGPAAISQVFLAAYKLGNAATGGDPIKVALALVTCLISLLLPSSFTAAFAYLGMMIVGGLITIADSRRPSRKDIYPVKSPPNKQMLTRMGMRQRDGFGLAFVTIGVFVSTWVIALSPGIPYPSEYGKQMFALFQTLFKMGGTIYGGGQVVLPMLENEFVNRCGDSPNYVEDFAGAAVSTGGCQWVSAETFAFGLALAQSLPGPLFNFSAFLGAAYLGVPGGFVGFIGALALPHLARPTSRAPVLARPRARAEGCAHPALVGPFPRALAAARVRSGLFGPGILLIYSFMPFWENLRAHAWVRCMLVGMNASSMGLVVTACVQLYFKYVRVSGEAVVMLLAAALVGQYKVGAPVAIFGCAALGWCLFVLDAGARARWPGVRSNRARAVWAGPSAVDAGCRPLARAHRSRRARLRRRSVLPRVHVRQLSHAEQGVPLRVGRSPSSPVSSRSSSDRSPTDLVPRYWST
jgi:chromate transporter